MMTLEQPEVAHYNVKTLAGFYKVASESEVHMSHFAPTDKR